jgi:hypothetical protein
MATSPRADFDPTPPEPLLSPDTRYSLVELGKKFEALHQDVRDIQLLIAFLKGLLYPIFCAAALIALMAMIKELAK